MFLATRCPHCDTVFRLQQEQLALHRGLVRCGHCGQVFDASQSLVPEHAQPAEPAPTGTETRTETASSAEAAVAAPRAGDAAQPAAPARLFADAPAHLPADAPSRANYKPEGWDMWAPWLDGGVDPSLHHTVHTVRTEPLVPLALPAIEAGVVHLSGTPAPIAPAAADADTVTDTHPAHSASQPADTRAPSHETDAPPPRTAPVDADPREPRFIAHVPIDAGIDTTEPVDAHARFAASQDDRAAPREPRFAPDAASVAAPAAREPAMRDAQVADTGSPAAPFAATLSDDDRAPFTVTRETRAPQRRGVLGGFFGGLVAAALTVLLVAQLAWWQREALMIHWPVTLSWFRQACAPLGCKVAPPRAIDGLRLDATDLRQIDGPRVLELKAPLTNRYRVALAYPSLELTLLDDTNRVTARRVLAPREYVRPGTPIDAGLAPGTTQTMIVRVDTNGTPASNFRVQIFYP
ncbi:DUF3426 domain-containing protein [Burkholderia pseudomultivorans]|uniref:Zinc finger/thioredoxin putative domain-containing protein n=1 Tax=Burkholderia pseudomultivorans TaxID=1207504 RepID=A0ABU2EA24_9BURK|nr:DUF3426 domain-containing protein [Burkholderia pseudomultivorans]MDR8728194.1 hypothetical protein [Burkholderia pseudomultivorans]MDR8735605.1 hypothetical protein [Burkholderia pseudomultivorans]MDR8741460.1 hypothetical protein [Burkholderia pseudomultivorans]MDR8756737.1 hypothetical protein [Burkholderia pseudomultivorans]MDR8777874.1 hypothetical protein [Burkholderia pseudomultivorans]